MRFLDESDYIRNSNEGQWAIFTVEYGAKLFLSSLYKKDLTWNEKALKYSDPKTLKFKKLKAIKIAKINKHRYLKAIGIVNKKGIQILI
jgi:hypothetical protein